MLREVHYDVKTQNLVSNPLPELATLRSGSLASERAVPLVAHAVHVVKGTSAGAAASADVNITFSGLIASGAGSTFGACVLGNATGSGGLGISITVTSSPTGNVGTAFIGACAGAAGAAGGVEQVAGTAGPSTFQLFDEDSVTVRITPDRSVADFFVQGGRWSATTSWL